MRVLLFAALACATAVPHAHAGCIDEFGKPRYQMPPVAYVDESGRLIVDPNAVTSIAGHAAAETFELVDCVK